MLVRFLRDFQSQHTGERFFTKGSTVELDSGDARVLLDEGAVELVPLAVREKQVDPVEPKPAPHKPTQRTTQKRGRG